MKAFTWFLLFVLMLVAATGYYIYRYVYIPKSIMLARLQDENLKLKYDIKDMVNRAYETCQKSVNLKESQTDSTEDNGSDSGKSIEHITFSFAIRDLFRKNNLSTRGKEIVKEFYSNIKDRKFDSLRVIINRKNHSAARKVLNIKKYLVSLGLEKDRVWARLSKDITKDSVVFRIYGR